MYFLYTWNFNITICSFCDHPLHKRGMGVMASNKFPNIALICRQWLTHIFWPLLEKYFRIRELFTWSTTDSKNLVPLSFPLTFIFSYSLFFLSLSVLGFGLNLLFYINFKTSLTASETNTGKSSFAILFWAINSTIYSNNTPTRALAEWIWLAS